VKDGTRRRTAFGAVGLAALLMGARSPETTGAVRPGLAVAERSCPAAGRVVSAGVALQPLIDGAAPGETWCLSPGTYAGPLDIHARLILQGPASAVITSTGHGTTVRALADGVVLRGFTVDGSGTRYDRLDAAVYVRGNDAVVQGLTVRHALFGIVVEQSGHVTIDSNRVTGLADLPVGIRGDGIRLWEVRHSTVTGNRLEDSRDIVVWYSPDNRITENTVTRSRYATHFMYSDDCVVAGNTYTHNDVGVFVMYSRHIDLRDNVIAENAGADGVGLGVKESGNLVVERNRFVRNLSCVYLDTSPFREGDSVLVRANVLAGCVAGVTFHSSETHNTFVGNAFLANQVAVAVEGRGTAQGVLWRENYFDDYQGYDLDGDGFGDVPYELRSMSERLVALHPDLAFFRGTMALALLDEAARVLPVLQPDTVLVDPMPRMALPGT
jgi:nitrous oxidase accessory protein